MCGVAGVIRVAGPPVAVDQLRPATTALAHRGPDDSGVWTDGRVGFAHTRLAIIDLAGSRQPMQSVDERFTLVFNGEIENYRELREQIRYPYSTDGDTEVILAAFVEHGVGAARLLRGQFAFVVHDAATGDVRMFRDPLGILPLYYAVDDGQIVFGSEIKALLALRDVAPEVDLTSVSDYLAARSVANPFTLFDGVRKVRPGHVLHVRRDGSISERAYWSPPGALLDLPAADAVERLDETLRAAVGSAMVADVPVGAYLSGGVDSSLIVAMMQRRDRDVPVHTFSAGFGDHRSDELPVARRVSALLGTQHHEVQVTAEDFASDWARLTWYRDAPLSEPADVAVAHLAVRAREHVKVVLSGEGSDELFAGYPKYGADAWLAVASVVPAAVRGRVVDLADPRLPDRARRLRVALRALGARDEWERFRAWFAPFTPSERMRLVGDPGRRPAGLRTAENGRAARMLALDLSTWLPDNLLERGDRMAMSASLELRPPFLDTQVVDLALQLPMRHKVRGRTTKWVVKQVAERYLPSEIVHRRKVGFTVPLDAWFRSGLREMSNDMLSKSSFVGTVMDHALVADLLRRHETGQSDEAIRIWTLLALEMWHQQFFGRSTPPHLSPAPAPA